MTVNYLRRATCEGKSCFWLIVLEVHGSRSVSPTVWSLMKVVAGGAWMEDHMVRGSGESSRAKLRIL